MKKPSMGSLGAFMVLHQRGEEPKKVSRPFYARFPGSTTGISGLLYRPDSLRFDTLPNVPAHTEARIRNLITEALTAKSDSEVERIIPELRSALPEHIRLAKESLEAQVVGLKRPVPEMP